MFKNIVYLAHNKFVTFWKVLANYLQTKNG